VARAGRLPAREFLLEERQVLGHTGSAHHELDDAQQVVARGFRSRFDPAVAQPHQHVEREGARLALLIVGQTTLRQAHECRIRTQLVAQE
jgi:hypothetical protein